jgi:hypothetical protein
MSQRGEPPKTDSAIHDIQSQIETIERNEALYDVTCFGGRVEALETITFDIIERIEGLISTSDRLDTLRALKQRAEQLREQLEEVDRILFQTFRATIRSGRYTCGALRREIHTVVGDSPDARPHDYVGYDCLDAFVDGLLLSAPAPQETRQREPEMVYYQPTAARVILQFIDRAHITGEDVLYDLGSGLGQVAILVHLLTGARAKGVEFEPAYCDYARECATALNLSGVEFVNLDAREADYSDGTVFFMYTPFEGRLLQEVLERLRHEARHRTIRVGTYGPCSLQVSRESWLQCMDQTPPHMHRLSVFRSISSETW